MLIWSMFMMTTYNNFLLILIVIKTSNQKLNYYFFPILSFCFLVWETGGCQNEWSFCLLTLLAIDFKSGGKYHNQKVKCLLFELIVIDFLFLNDTCESKILTGELHSPSTWVLYWHRRQHLILPTPSQLQEQQTIGLTHNKSITQVIRGAYLCCPWSHWVTLNMV